MSTRSICQYVLNHLSVLTDEELAELDFDAGLAAIDDEVDPDDRRKLEELFSLINKELPIRHHGVKGMKWGVRRYQYKDGTLTPAGRQRLADETAKQSLFGTASKYKIKTRSGEVITAEPVKPWSTGTKIVKALLGVSEKDELGRRGDANYTLTDSKGKSIGELSLISKNSKTAYIDWVTIDESQRGKGYATDIINDLLSKARDSGYSKVELNALKKPRPLYERLGFTYTDTSKMSIIDRISGFEFGTKHMEYDLNNLAHNRFDRLYYIGSERRYSGLEYEIYHHGVKGMKWGIRRYQNNDGTLTPAGKKRQAKADYRTATDKAFKKYTKGIEAVEKGYKRGQKLSEQDLDREAAIESRYNSSVAKAKATYKQEKRNIANEKRQLKKDAKAEEISKTVDRWGVGGVAMKSASAYAKKTAGKEFVARAVNAAANAYIGANSASRVAKGVDYTRRAVIMGLSVSNIVDKANVVKDVGAAYKYRREQYGM